MGAPRTIEDILEEVPFLPDVPEDQLSVPIAGKTLKRGEGPSIFVQQYCARSIGQGTRLHRQQMNSALVDWSDELR